MDVIGWANSTGGATAGGLTRYLNLVSTNANIRNTALYQAFASRGIMKHLRVDISANTLVGTCTVEIYTESSAGGVVGQTLMTITVGAGVTGLQSEDLAEVAIGPETRFTCRVVTGAGAGTVTIDSVSVLVADPWTCAHRTGLV